MSTQTLLPPAAKPAPKVPPLAAGDRLTRAEFERRYSAMPEDCKAELIEGEVYMASPVRALFHGRPQSILVTWLGVYDSNTPGTISMDNSTVRLDLDNEPQPDVLLLIESSHGGAVHIGEDDYIEGAPELVAEVSASTISIDLHKKLRVYQRNGVKEYIVLRVEDAEVDWFVLRGGQFERLSADADGIIRSPTFPGLWLDAAALTAANMPEVLRTVGRGTSSPEHAAFVAALREAAKS